MGDYVWFHDVSWHATWHAMQPMQRRVSTTIANRRLPGASLVSIGETLSSSLTSLSPCWATAAGRGKSRQRNIRAKLRA